MASNVHLASLSVNLNLFDLLFLLLLISCLFFIIFLHNNEITIFKVLLSFFNLFHALKNGVLFQLMPKKVNIRAGWVWFLNRPPRSVSSEQIFNQWRIVSLSNIQSVLSFDLMVYFDVVWQIYHVKKFFVECVFLLDLWCYFRFLFLFNTFLLGLKLFKGRNIGFFGSPSSHAQGA